MASLRSLLLRCTSTVFSVTNTASAISLFGQPFGRHAGHAQLARRGCAPSRRPRPARRLRGGRARGRRARGPIRRARPAGRARGRACRPTAAERPGPPGRHGTSCRFVGAPCVEEQHGQLHSCLFVHERHLHERRRVALSSGDSRRAVCLPGRVLPIRLVPPIAPASTPVPSDLV
jgi:hypothetical protein